MDNSDSKKEKVSHTYRNYEGYLFLPAYIGIEGWMINGHLLPGSQHPQKEFVPFLRETNARIRQLSANHRQPPPRMPPFNRYPLKLFGYLSIDLRRSDGTVP